MPKVIYEAVIEEPETREEIKNEDYDQWKAELIDCVREFHRQFGHLPHKDSRVGYKDMDYLLIDYYIFTKSKEQSTITIVATTL